MRLSEQEHLQLGGTRGGDPGIQAFFVQELTHRLPIRAGVVEEVNGAACMAVPGSVWDRNHIENHKILTPCAGSAGIGIATPMRLLFACLFAAGCRKTGCPSMND